MLEWCTKVGIPHESVNVNFCHDPIYYNISLLSYAQKDYIKQFLTNNLIDEQVSKFIDTQHVEEIKNNVVEHAKKMAEDDITINMTMGKNGSKLFNTEIEAIKFYPNQIQLIKPINITTFDNVKTGNRNKRGRQFAMRAN